MARVNPTTPAASILADGKHLACETNNIFAGTAPKRDLRGKQESDLTRVDKPMDTSSQNIPDLGAVRTLMAADRTLMAWICTALSMLSFGYTIYKVLQEVQDVTAVPLNRTTPRNAGLFLTVAGTLALIMGVAEYYGNLRMLRRLHLFRRIRPTLIMSVLMAIAGMLLSFGIIVKAT